MKRSVPWSEDALNDLDSSMGYIAERNPVAARKVSAEIARTASQLGARAIGRAGRVAGTYEKSVTERPYIIAYALVPQPDEDEIVAILRVIHPARDWPAGGWPS